MEEDILNYLYQLSCFVGHPVVYFTKGSLDQFCLQNIQGAARVVMFAPRG